MIAGVFRGIQVAEFPVRLDPFYLATEIEADPMESGRQEFEVRMIDEDGANVYVNTIVTDFDKRPNFLPSYMYFCGHVFVKNEIQGPGIYRFDMLWNGETLAQTRLEITG